ncbi:MAG: ribonuclease H-like domain-containing protein [Anaerolineales bacterium]
MPSLSDKLKALGVSIGPESIKSADKPIKFPIEEVVSNGEEINTSLGSTFLITKTYSEDPRKKDFPLKFPASLTNLSIWVGNPELVKQKPASFAFIDTETSGLAGGTGTYAFLIGIGKFTDAGFQLSQYFMRDPFEESAQLLAVLSALDGCEVLVTYNGKSFDIPLLNSRFIANGEPAPLNSYQHIDLLHLARRLWRDRLESRTLGSIEENILETPRTGDDIPGWLVPTIYFNYIKSGDARPIANVLYHNAMDIISLASLLDHISIILEDPHGGRVDNGVDLIAMAKIFEDMGEFSAAAECYQRGLYDDLPYRIRNQAFQRWSIMEKRRNNLEQSIGLWKTAAESREIYAHEELAKAFEHKIHDLEQAIYWTELALEIIKKPDYPVIEREIWTPKLQHRLKRLQRKLAAAQ